MSARSPSSQPVPATRNVILIGGRGSGKTSVGRELAAHLGWSFIDTDAQIEAASGRTIRDLFEQDGEAFFRRLEAGVIRGIIRHTEQVVSAGGGAVLSAENRNTLRAAGVCIWLAAPAEELYRRIQSDPRTAATRPALTDQAGVDEVRQLLRERGPLYAELAQHVVETAGRSVAQVVADVAALLTRPRGTARKR